MKKYIVNPRYFLVVLGIFLITFSGYSQAGKISRKDRKDAKRAMEYAYFQHLDTILTSKAFVLEADFIENQYGQRINVTPILNFIRVDSIRAVLQTGSSRYLGYNGVGGVTAEGQLNRYDLSRNTKNLSLTARFSVNTNIGFYDVLLTVTGDNYARATITGLTPGRLIYTGKLHSVYDSRVYKGQNSY